jgi:hypothetical protein
MPSFHAQCDQVALVSSPILAMVEAPGTSVPSFNGYFWCARVFFKAYDFASVLGEAVGLGGFHRLSLARGRLACVVWAGIECDYQSNLCVVGAGLGRRGRGLAHVEAVGLRAAAVAPGDEVKDLDGFRLQRNASAEAGRVPSSRERPRL